MLCRSCKKNVDSSMKHAITANLCPFCGSPIFDAGELAVRKGISRVLIKNGLEKDDVINKIVDDIMDLATGSVEKKEEGVSVEDEVAARVAEQRAMRSAETHEDDGLTPEQRVAPSRVLTPAPRPTAQTAVTGGVDPIAAAMRVFEEENADPMRRVDEDVPSQSEADDAAGIFFMEKGGGEKVEEKRRLAQQARASGLMGGGGRKAGAAFSRPN